MSYVIAENLAKSFGTNQVFADIQFTIEKANLLPYLGQVVAENRLYYVVSQGLNNLIMVNFISIARM